MFVADRNVFTFGFHFVVVVSEDFAGVGFGGCVLGHRAAEAVEPEDVWLVVVDYLDDFGFPLA